MSDDDVTDEMLLGAMARVANHMDVVGRLQRENAALAAEVERVKGEADEARANLILQTICRLPSVLTTDDWQDFLEEHRHEWLNDDRAFGGWVSQRLSVAIATARAGALREVRDILDARAWSIVRHAVRDGRDIGQHQHDYETESAYVDEAARQRAEQIVTLLDAPRGDA